MPAKPINRSAAKRNGEHVNMELGSLLPVKKIGGNL